jgi:hypothetical protein
LKIAGLRDGGYVGAVAVTGVYFDCANLVTGTKRVFDMPADALPNFFVYDVRFAGACYFGNAPEDGFLIRKAISGTLSIGGACRFANITRWAIDIQGSASTDISVTGASFGNVAIGGTGGAVRVNGAQAFTYTGNTLRTDGGPVSLVLTGTIASASLTGNTHAGNTLDLSRSGATFTNGLSMSGNMTIDRAATTISKGTLTPSLSIGGVALLSGSYTVRTGSFEWNGNGYTFEVRITLSSKEARTGDLLISGLPQNNAVSSGSTPVSFWCTAVTSGVGDTMLTATVPTGSTGVSMFKMSGGSASLLGGVDLTDTSILRLSGRIPTA